MKVLLTEEQIREKILDLAEVIAKDSSTRKLHVIFVLKGAFIFCSDLVRGLSRYQTDITIDYIVAKSYIGTESSGNIELLIDVDIEGKEVLLVEDIIDTGRTILKIKEELLKRQPASLKTVCFLDKPARREVSVKGDYVGFEIEDRFIVGYGLDCDEKYRYLPFIAEIGESDM